MLFDIISRFVPTKIKYILKPYLRYVFPNMRMAVLFPTFRCTYSCSYCPYCKKESNFPEQFPISCEKTGEEWIDALSKLPPTAFYFCGGEPFLYKDLPYIINNMPKKHSITGIISNLSMPLEIYKKINKKLRLNVSFHREFAKEDEFIEKILSLKDRFNIAVNIVATEENFDFIKNKIQIFDKNKIPYHIDLLIDNAQGAHKYSDEYKAVLEKLLEKSRNFKTEELLSLKCTKKCSAGRNYFNVLPNGDAVLCSRAIDYKYSPFVEKDDNKAFNLGNIFNGTFKLNSKDIICNYDCLIHCDRDFAKISITDKNKIK